MTSKHSRSGFTMLELMVAVAMIGLITALAVPSMRATIKNSRTKVAASDVAGLLNFARSKAMQTGNPHLVYFTNDRNGPLMQGDGAGVLQSAAMMVAADADEDCVPDAGAPVWSLLAFDTGINFQKDPAIVQLPTDTGEAGDVVTEGLGVSFTDPGGADTTWISFGFDGIPRRFDVGLGDCDPTSQSEIGLGGGVIYIAGRFPTQNFNTGRQYAIELTPLGGVKLYRYDYATAAWRIR